MRWTLWRQAGSLAGRNAAAYGEVVWSWRRDRGVYPAGLCWAGNGDKKRRSPGRARISRKAIARGKPGCLGCTCLTRVRCLLFCTRCCGRSQRPAFPASSAVQRDDEIAKPGRNHVAGMRRCVQIVGRISASVIRHRLDAMSADYALRLIRPTNRHRPNLFTIRGISRRAKTHYGARFVRRMRTG